MTAEAQASEAGYEYDLFVAYARADAEFVRETLLPSLKLPPTRVCLVHRLQIGSVRVAAIADAVTRSRYTIAVLSRAYLQEQWEQFGTNLALHVHANDARVIPLRLEQCVIPIPLQARIELDFTDPANWQSELDRLSELLRGGAVAGESPITPSPTAGMGGRWFLPLCVMAAAASLLIYWLRLKEDRSMVRFSAAKIRPGVFGAGSRPAECRALTSDEDCAELADPQSIVQVDVQAFELDRYEVTNEEFAAWLNASGNVKMGEYGIITTRTDPQLPLVRIEKCGEALTVGLDSRVHVAAGTKRWPVICVSWYGADEYCRAHGKRLPLETEWELAAKGADGRPFPWGSESPRPGGVAFAPLDEGQRPRDVGSSRQDISPDGVYDLGGNAAEWVQGRRSSAGTRTLRGGSFHSTPCRLLGSGCRHITPDKYQKDIGFRCARSVIELPR